MNIALRLKQDALERVEDNNSEWVEKARTAAKLISDRDGHVSADVLRSENRELFAEPHHYNAHGAIFNVKEFRHIGWKPSENASRHNAWIRIWTYREWS